MASGSSQPICSATSYPIVFLPSMRYGSLSVETSNQPSWGARSATMRPQSEMMPSTSVTCAPYADDAVHQRDVRAVRHALQVVGLRNVARHEDMRLAIVGIDGGGLQ